MGEDSKRQCLAFCTFSAARQCANESKLWCQIIPARVLLGTVFFKPLFQDIYGMEIEMFSHRPIDTIDLNFYVCSVFHSYRLRVLKWKL